MRDHEGRHVCTSSDRRRAQSSVAERCQIRPVLLLLVELLPSVFATSGIRISHLASLGPLDLRRRANPPAQDDAAHGGANSAPDRPDSLGCQVSGLAGRCGVSDLRGGKTLHVRRRDSLEGSSSWDVQRRIPAELRQRAVRLVQEARLEYPSVCEVVRSVATKLVVEHARPDRVPQRSATRSGGGGRQLGSGRGSTEADLPAQQA
jgi:hypothetical protein